MPPTDWLSLLLILLFVAPGFLYTRAYWQDSFHYEHEPSDFQQIIISIIASTIIHLILVTLISSIVLLWPALQRWLISISTWQFNTPPSLSGLGFTLLLLSFYLSMSLISGWLGGLFIRQRKPPPLRSGWVGLIAKSQAREKDVRLRLHLHNGEQYQGILDRFSRTAGKEALFELILRAVVCENLENGQTKPVSPGNSRVMFSSNDILWVAIMES